jgi:hypothetical protein
MGSSAADIYAMLMEKAAKAPEVREHVDQVVDSGVKFARGNAPVGTAAGRDPHPGQFRNSIHSDAIPDVHGMPAGRIVSDDPNAGFIEFGTERTTEHGTFAKTQVYLESEFDAHPSGLVWDKES